MNQHQTDKRIRLPRRAWFIALVAIFPFAVASLPQLGSIVRAQEPDSNSGSQANTVPPPPGDCWGGALSDDPLHCYALEEAQRDGIIEVEGVYDASGELHIFFNYRTGPPVTALFDQGRFEDLLETLKDNARDFIARFPERVTYNLPIPACKSSDPAETYRDCVLRFTFDIELLPWDSPYTLIRLFSGGIQKRRDFSGWASWDQVWPASESNAAGASDGFDISDVDLTNFPDMKCEDRGGGYACNISKNSPEWGIAGWHEPFKDLYIQVKAAPGEEDAAVAALRAEFARRYGDTNSYGYLRDAVITPVKYSYEELWRWQLLLDRFGLSSGNTIGIFGGEIMTNITDSWVADRIVYLRSDLQEADRDDLATYRETIVIETGHDADHVASQLPVLLSQLGIPADAVGILWQWSPPPISHLVSTVGFVSDSSGSPVGDATETDGAEMGKAGQETTGTVEDSSGGATSISGFEGETEAVGEESSQVDEQDTNPGTTQAEASEVVRVKSVSADDSPSKSASDETIKAEQETADLRDSTSEPADVASDHMDTTADDPQKIVVEETVVEAKDGATVLSGSSIETGEAVSNETAAADGNSSEATIGKPSPSGQQPDEASTTSALTAETGRDGTAPSKTDSQPIARDERVSNKDPANKDVVPAKDVVADAVVSASLATKDGDAATEDSTGSAMFSASASGTNHISQSPTAGDPALPAPRTAESGSETRELILTGAVAGTLAVFGVTLFLTFYFRRRRV